MVAKTHATLMRFKSDFIAAFTFRAQCCARNVEAARESDLNRIYATPADIIASCGRQVTKRHVADF